MKLDFKLKAILYQNVKMLVLYIIRDVVEMILWQDFPVLSEMTGKVCFKWVFSRCPQDQKCP